MNSKEQITIKGEITARAYRQANVLLNIINGFVEEFMKLNPKLRRWLFDNIYFKGQLVNVYQHKNVICNAGLARVAGGLVPSSGVTLGVINKMLLGTGVGSATATDTQLITETYRNDTASGTYAGNICYLTAFFTQAEVTGTFKEFGNVIGGTGSANTGYLWSHLTGLTWAKDSVTTLTVDCKYTFASV
jgi:hypothetical protein